MSRHPRLAVIGGSGLYAMEGLEDVEELWISTPFGPPSDSITVGRLDDTEIAFLPRHGRGHVLSPTEVPSRANIHALKSLGVNWIISVSAVGSLREDYRPLDLVLPDQIFDRTRARVTSFYEHGIVAHVSFAEPFCPQLRETMWQSMTAAADFRSHRDGTYVCIEGPQFSTKAESNIYRKLGCDVIGMTALPEAKLAREAEIHYATIACITDYDVWHETEEAVSLEVVVANLQRNVQNAQRLIRETMRGLASPADWSSCGCESAMQHAILTERSAITPEVRERYSVLVGRYLN